MKVDDLLRAYEEFDLELYVSLSDSIIVINKYSIDDELIKHSRLYSYYSGLYEYATKKVRDKENELERSSALLKEDARELLSEKGTRATVAAVDTIVLVNSDLNNMKNELEELRYKQGLLKSLITSMQHRKDMLIQLSANIRAETKLITD